MKEVEKILIRKENDEVSVSQITERADLGVQAGVTHLCWDCANGCPANCNKVKDIKKKNIEAYPFITSGYQVFNTNGNMDRMIVTECKDYQYIKAEQKTPQEQAKISDARKKLRLLYFGAQTLSQANRIQNDLLDRGQLISPRGRNRGR